MTVCYYENDAPDPLKKSLFLAGPTPRTPEVQSWRPEALDILESLGYDGTVFIPEFNGPAMVNTSYEDMVEWEDKALHMADQIVFWIPRDMKTLPGLTTNIEAGRWEGSGKIVLGHPDKAPHMSYLDTYAQKEGTPVFNNLEDTLREALKRLGDGAPRTGGEREIPLYIWKTPEFKAWYAAQKGAGNRLDSAKVVWAFRVGPAKQKLFMWALHVKVWITSEDRFKTNEVILQRPDIFAVVAFKRPDPLPEWVQPNPGDSNVTANTKQMVLRDYRKSLLLETEVALVREFRSPATTPDCFIHELPGGSVIEGNLSPEAKAVEELEEETGLAIPVSRLKVVGTRQIYGTLLTHSAHVFSVELTSDEMLSLKWIGDQPHGIEADSERTFVEVRTVADILSQKDVDWSCIGMIVSALKPG